MRTFDGYYVYILRDAENVPFYVGKGCFKRATHRQKMAKIFTKDKMREMSLRNWEGRRNAQAAS